MRMNTQFNTYGTRSGSLAYFSFRFAACLAMTLAGILILGVGNSVFAQIEFFEMERERQMSIDAEQTTKMFEYRAPKRSGKAATSSLGSTKPLFAGVDDVAVPAYLIDPADASTEIAFTGVQVWGAAYDAANARILFNSGSTLWEWPVGGTAAQLGPMVDGGGAAQSLVSLAWHNGELYGTKNVTTEAIWKIDTTTRVATIFITYPTTHDLGGLAVDPNSGEFYATDDATQSLVRVNSDGTITTIAPYPAGQTDLDALAISGDGRAFLVPDEPGLIYVYDLVGGTYLTPFANPWTSSEIFSGAAWVQAPSAAATISGRVVSQSGGAIANVLVRMTDGGSFNAVARSSSFGYFTFEGVPTGTTYTVTSESKQYSFTPLNLPVAGDITDLEITAEAPLIP